MITVDLQDVARYMRMGSEEPSGPLAAQMRSILDKAYGAIRPATAVKRFDIVNGSVASGRLDLNRSQTLSGHLHGCHAAYLVCGTLGPGFDALHRTISVTSASGALILQAAGTAMIEKLMDESENVVMRELGPGESTTSRYSPGYGDFPLEAQREILSLLDSSRKIGVSVTDTLLMVPSKSVSAIIGVRTDLSPRSTGANRR